MTKYDLIILPTTPGTAFEFWANSADPIKMYLEDIFTVQAISPVIPLFQFPAGKNKDGLPFGIQVMAGKFEEGKLFAFSKYIHEQVR